MHQTRSMVRESKRDSEYYRAKRNPMANYNPKQAEISNFCYNFGRAVFLATKLHSDPIKDPKFRFALDREGFPFPFVKKFADNLDNESRLIAFAFANVSSCALRGRSLVACGFSWLLEPNVGVGGP